MNTFESKVSSSSKTQSFITRNKDQKSLFFQPKLIVGPVDDAYEREADAVADKVMRTDNEGPVETGISPVDIQRKCAHCEEEEKVQRKGDGRNSGDINAPDIVTGVLKSGGQSLDVGTQSFMEQRFGYDFSGVKIHTDTVAAKSAESINALAYTSGNSIVFNEGQYAPGTDEGKNLLAHELTHVVQQQQNLQRTIQRRVIDRNVVTNAAILTSLGMTRQQVIDTIRAADADAIILAQNSEDTLTAQLNNARNGDPIDLDAELILNEELGLSFNNPAHSNLIRQQIRRFRTVRETLVSGYLRYVALGIGNVSLVGCEPGNCGDNFAFSCEGNRLIVLCQTFWDRPNEQSDTLLHEPFHVWFSMARHQPDALRRADASCFESFALRVSGRNATASCAAHTAG
jgi:hypothetical protein